MLKAEGRRLDCEISLLFCTDEQIRRLNREFRQEDSATDVLSFPQQEPGAPNQVVLGDIAVSVPTAQRQAAAAGHSLAVEVDWLVLHGVLHLIGHDDHTSDGLAEMIRRQTEVLRAARRPAPTVVTAAPQPGGDG